MKLVITNNFSQPTVNVNRLQFLKENTLAPSIERDKNGVFNFATFCFYSELAFEDFLNAIKNLKDVDTAYNLMYSICSIKIEDDLIYISFDLKFIHTAVIIRY